MRGKSMKTNIQQMFPETQFNTNNITKVLSGGSPIKKVKDKSIDNDDEYVEQRSPRAGIVEDYTLPEFIPPSMESHFKGLKFYICPGNNGSIVKSTLKSRFWWVEGKKDDFRDANFIWTQWTKKSHFEYIQRQRLKQPI